MARKAVLRIVTQRWRLLLVTVLLLGISVAIWVLLQPPEMRLVARYALSPEPPELCIVFGFSGQMLHVGHMFDQPYSQACYDVNGRLIWHFAYPGALPPASAALRHAFHENYRSFLPPTPDIRYQAMMIVQGTYQEVRSWDHGTLLGAARLPLGRTLVDATVLDNGDILCWYPHCSPSPVYLIHGSQIRARGMLAIPPGYKGDYAHGVNGRFTFDGKAFVLANPDGFRYYAVHITGSTLHLTPVYAADNLYHLPKHFGDALSPPNIPSLFSSSLLISYAGARYNDRGRIDGPTGWLLANKRHIHDGIIIQSQDYFTVRILDVRTGLSWVIPADRWSEFCETTPDGRYAMLDHQTGFRESKGIRSLMEHAPDPIQSGFDYLFPYRSQHELRLYERPGRLLARLTIEKEPGSMIYHMGHGVTADLYDFMPSADGHTLYAIGTVTDNGKTTLEILQFRW